MKNEQIFLNSFFILAVSLMAYLSYGYEHYKFAMVMCVILGALVGSFVNRVKA